MTRTDIINYLILKNNYKNYLEIGVRNKDDNFYKIVAPYKTGVDPDPNTKADFVMTSDDFFSNNKSYFDIIFIDGLHTKEQVLKDIDNSLNYLNDGGVILCHDCLPASYEEQVVPQIQSTWTGDVWKAIAYLRMNNKDLCVEVVDTDCGCGVITKKPQNLFISNTYDIIDYNFYAKYRQSLMNVITTQEFIYKYGQGERNE